MRAWALSACFVLLLFCFGCASPVGADAGGKPRVVVTTYFLEDFAKGVGGDKVEVVNLLPDGANPHSYEPSPVDVMKAHNAQVLVYNGAGLEPYVQSLAESLPSSVVVVEASKGMQLIASEHEHEHEEEHGEYEEEHEEEAAQHEPHQHGYYDPHVWLDPLLAKQEVEAIRLGLVQADPQNADYYSSRALAYTQKLDALDEEIRSSTALFSRREYIGFHPSFTYFNARYNLSYAAVIEEFAGQEPNAQELARIVDVTREKNISTVFSEPFLDPRAAEAIAREINGQVLVLNPLATLTPADRAEGKEYFSVMRKNVGQLRKVLN